MKHTLSCQFIKNNKLLQCQNTKLKISLNCPLVNSPIIIICKLSSESGMFTRSHLSTNEFPPPRGENKT